MIRYENYKMRVVEIRHKKIDLDTEEITDVVRYMLEWKFPWSFGWTKDTAPVLCCRTLSLLSFGENARMFGPVQRARPGSSTNG